MMWRPAGGEDPAIAEIRARLVKLSTEMRALRTEFDALADQLAVSTDIAGRGSTPSPTSSGTDSGGTE